MTTPPFEPDDTTVTPTPTPATPVAPAAPVWTAGPPVARRSRPRP